MEEIKEKIIHIVLEEGMVCALTNKGRIFMQVPVNNKAGNYGWREMEVPDFNNEQDVLQ